MSRGPFEPLFDELPRSIPLFPLSGALLLPGGRLPLNIFEPRYLAMVQDAMATPHRMIGMIQPQGNEDYFDVGCAGRIAEYSESDDGRVLISLAGSARFTCHDTRLQEAGFLIGTVDFSAFKADLIPDENIIDRDNLLGILKSYFEVKGFSADWSHIEDCEDDIDYPDNTYVGGSAIWSCASTNQSANTVVPWFILFLWVMWNRRRTKQQA